MKTAIIILSILVALLYLKWVLIILVFPFQVVHGQVLKRWGVSKDTPVVLKVLKQPYKYWEKLFRKGWQRYMLYQIGLIPSRHVRRQERRFSLSNRNTGHTQTEGGCRYHHW